MTRPLVLAALALVSLASVAPPARAQNVLTAPPAPASLPPAPAPSRGRPPACPPGEARTAPRPLPGTSAISQRDYVCQNGYVPAAAPERFRTVEAPRPSPAQARRAARAPQGVRTGSSVAISQPEYVRRNGYTVRSRPAGVQTKAPRRPAAVTPRSSRRGEAARVE